MPDRPELKELLARAKAYVESLTPEQYQAMIEEQKKSWLRAELEFAKDEGRRTIAVPAASPPMPPDPSNLERARAMFCAAHASVDSQSTIYAIAAALDERERAGFEAGAAAMLADACQVLNDAERFRLRSLPLPKVPRGA